MDRRRKYVSLSRRTRHVVMVTHPDAQILDVVGPIEILASVNDFMDSPSPAYRVTLAAPQRGAFATTCGVELVAHRGLDDFSESERLSIDTVMVAGGNGTAAAMRDPKVLRFLQSTAQTANRVVSICTGAFVLAEAGLLKGKRATTHWHHCDALQRNYPDTDVDRDAIYVRDGNVWTSAGVTAGMDLALALVAEDWGQELALAVARAHVMFMIRPGGQSQYSAHLLAQKGQGGPLANVLNWIVENTDQTLSVADLADRACMSERSFLRKFKSTTGTTPARFVEAARVETAKRILEREGASVDRVAHKSGFGNAERMRRAFQRHLGIAPVDYRQRFYAPGKPLEQSNAFTA